MASPEGFRARLARRRAAVPRAARVAVALLALGLAVATFGPTLARGAGLELPAWERFTRAACRPFCHQLPRRSLAVGGRPMPLCARCTGMWLGILAGAAAGALWSLRRRYLVGLLVAAAGLGASAAEWLREGAGHPSWAWARLGFGFVLFLGVAGAVSGDLLALLAGRERRR
jgi:hypothetical protein